VEDTLELITTVDIKNDLRQAEHSFLVVKMFLVKKLLPTIFDSKLVLKVR